MTAICISHNGIRYGETTWVYPKEDVTEIVRLAQKPAMITTCPKCQEKIERMKKFLSYDPNEVKHGQKTTQATPEAKKVNPKTK